MYSSMNCQIYAIGSYNRGCFDIYIKYFTGCRIFKSRANDQCPFGKLNYNVQQAIHAQLKLVYFSIIGGPFGSL